MGIKTVVLTHGLKIGEELAMDAVLREATAGDIIDAALAAERVMPIGDGYQIMQSPTLAAIELLRRRIERIGAFDGVVTMSMIRKLHPDDLAALQDAADTIEAAVNMEASNRRGRGDPPAGDD